MNGKNLHLEYRKEGKTFSLDIPVPEKEGKESLAVPPGHPIALDWEIIGRDGTTILSIMMSSPQEIILKQMVLTLETGGTFQRHFLNGYQSWTDSGEYPPDVRFHKLAAFARPLLRYMGDQRFIPSFYESQLNPGSVSAHGYHYIYGVPAQNRDGIGFVGSLDERFAYTIFSMNNGNVLLHKDVQDLPFSGEKEIFRIMTSQGEINAVFDRYFSLYEKDKEIFSGIIPASFSPGPQDISRPLTGWTSWYHYYTNITEEIILENIRSFAGRRIPLDIFQIDDGYQNAVGDWLTFNEKFPRKFDTIVPEIHAAGYQAGLWLAPFITEKKSFIFRDHPDWLATDKDGNLVKAGFNPLWGGWTNGFFYALDIYHPGFQEYLKEVFHTVLHEWNFDMVKLDFLYAAGMNHRGNKSRSESMHNAVDLISFLCQGKKVLGCGLPLGAGYGKMDSCRIGSDIGLEWEDKTLKRIHYRERISTLNSLRSTLGRWHLNHRAWRNDPDVFNLRSGDNRLLPGEKYTLMLVNLTLGGTVFTSDSMGSLNDEEYKTYLSIFPSQRKEIHSVQILEADVFLIKFSIRNYHYQLLVNLSDTEYQWNNSHPLAFNSRKYGFLFDQKIMKIPPHESLLLLIPEGRDFTVLGSSGYLYPGAEVAEVSGELTPEKEARIEIKTVENLMKTGEVYIRIPDSSVTAVVNGKKVKTDSIRNIKSARFLY